MKNIIKTLYDLLFHIIKFAVLCVSVYIYSENKELFTINNLFYILIISLFIITIIRFYMINNNIKTDEEEAEEYYFKKNLNNYIFNNYDISSINELLILLWKKIKDSKIPFNNFIEKNKNLDPNDYMYMYSDENYDYFKHHDTREYIKVRYVSYLQLVKNIINYN